MAEMLKTFAEDLKAIREEKNLTLRTISQQTRISLSILENLEHGDYAFQPQAYIRAFLKQYINCLGLDTEDVLFEYDLARSGKYKSKRQNNINETLPEKGLIKEPEEKPKNTDRTGETIDTPGNNDDETNSDKKSASGNRAIRISEQRNTGVSKTEGTINSKPAGKENPKYQINDLKDKLSLSILNSPVARNIAVIVVIILVLLGIYSIINILFFEKSTDNPEVIRQNFNDVVKEQEQKILGKRTPEEIQDSIKRAEDELISSGELITLKITGLRPGTIFLVSDSVNYSKPEKIDFGKNEVREFKTKKSFHMSSANTDDFDAMINNKLIKFGKLSISKVKLDKNGVKK